MDHNFSKNKSNHALLVLQVTVFRVSRLVILSGGRVYVTCIYLAKFFFICVTQLTFFSDNIVDCPSPELIAVLFSSITD